APGTGKTHLVAAIANQLMHTDAAPLYVVVPDFLAFLRDGFESGHGDGAEARMEQAKAAGVLLLDDLGAEKRSEWADEQLERLLNHRYYERLPTVIGSNLIPDEMEMRIASRMQDRRLSRVVPILASDYRQEA